MNPDRALNTISASSVKPSDVLSHSWNAFLILYECRSFAKASKVLGISQPALTKRIHRLEDEIGMDLFDRNCRPIAPTPEAKILRDELLHMSLGAGKILRDLRNKNFVKPVLRVGCVPSLSSYLIPALVDAFLPKISLFTHYMGSSEVLVGRLLRREADIAIVCDAFDEIPSLSRQELFEEPSIILMPKSFSNIRKFSSWSELSHYGLPLISAVSNTGGGKLNLRFLASENLNFPSICEVESDAVMIKLVANGVGWAVTRPSTLLSDPQTANSIAVFPTPAPSFSLKFWCISRPSEYVDESEEIQKLSKDVFRKEILPQLQKFAPWVNFEQNVST